MKPLNSGWRGWTGEVSVSCAEKTRIGRDMS
jgi:hypothetical protein